MRRQQREILRLAALNLAVSLYFAVGQACAYSNDRGWTYDYFDTFNTTKAVRDSINHSLFCNDFTVLPKEPFLCYSPNDGFPDRGLVFVEHEGVPAHIAYRFPLAGTVDLPHNLRIGGTIDFDIKPLLTPDEGGRMFYSMSSDGVTWSPPAKAVNGHNRIWASSTAGTVFVRFLGHNVAFDNLIVHLRYGVAYHVNNRSNTDVNNTGLNQEEPLPNIQDAIDLAFHGDRIFVWPGIYNLSAPINFQRKEILVQSISDAAVLRMPGNYAVTFEQGENYRSVLRNFVICDSYTGVFIQFGSPTLTNLTIADNNHHAVHSMFDAHPVISNCIFWNNPDGDLVGCHAQYSCFSDNFISGAGNIRAHPLFVDPNSFDYHLKSQRGRFLPPEPNQPGLIHTVIIKDDVTSPCIDRGDPNLYPMAEPMPNGGRINMGAFGDTAWASLSVIPWLKSADCNRDGIVNLFDYALAAKNNIPVHAVLRSWLWHAPWYDQRPTGYYSAEP
jgi:hypothetical protein